MDSTQKTVDAAVTGGESRAKRTSTGQSPRWPESAFRTEARGHNQRGAAKFAEQDLDGALAEFNAALRLDPGLASAYNNRGVVRQQLRDLAGALADFDAALRLNPRFADACSNRAAIRGDLGDVAGAESDCRLALALAPGSATIHARRVALLHKQKNLPAALLEYDCALRLDPRLYWVYILRGNARYHSGNWHGLRADYEQGFALHAERSAAMAARSLMLGLASNSVEALAKSDEHLRKDPEDPISYARRGLLLLLVGRAAEADEDFDQCLARYPDAKSYLELIARQIGRLGGNSGSTLEAQPGGCQGIS